MNESLKNGTNDAQINSIKLFRLKQAVILNKQNVVPDQKKNK
jgi:hypothetical protein